MVAYQNHKLRVGNFKWRGVLEDELTYYRLKQNINTNHVSFEPLREGQHDDLLFATCLGVWAWEGAVKKIKHLSTPNAIMTDLQPNAALQHAPAAVARAWSRPLRG